MAETIRWEGASGRGYRYWIYPIHTTFKAQPGNYIFAVQTQPGRWAPAYIGETSSLRERLESHEKEECARRHGATHIHAHISNGQQARRAEEADLIARWEPGCNG